MGGRGRHYENYETRGGQGAKGRVHELGNWKENRDIETLAEWMKAWEQVERYYRTGAEMPVSYCVVKEIHSKPGCFSSEQALFWLGLYDTSLNFPL